MPRRWPAEPVHKVCFAASTHEAAVELYEAAAKAGDYETCDAIRPLIKATATLPRRPDHAS